MKPPQMTPDQRARLDQDYATSRASITKHIDQARRVLEEMGPADAAIVLGRAHMKLMLGTDTPPADALADMQILCSMFSAIGVLLVELARRPDPAP